MSPLEQLEQVVRDNGAELTLRYEMYAQTPGAYLLTWCVEWKRDTPTGVETVTRYNNNLMAACVRLLEATAGFGLKTSEGD